MTHSPQVRQRFSVPRLVGAALLLLAMAGGAYGLWRPPAPVAPVRLALPIQISSTTALVALDAGQFRKAAVEVQPQPYLLGKDALNAMLAGKADLAIVADTPFMFAVLAGKPVMAVATVSQARRALAIVAHKNHGVTRISDLHGKTIGLTMGTNLPYFLDSLLDANAVPSDAVQRRDMKVEQVLAGFRSGAINAAVVFQPYLEQLRVELGPRMAVFHGEDVYAFRFLLVGKPDYVAAHPETIQRVLRGLVAARAAIHHDPQAARQVVARAVKIDAGLLARLFDPEDFTVTLDQSLLISLDDQTRWAMKAALAPNGPVPNYLHHISYRDLATVQPSAIKLIH